MLRLSWNALLRDLRAGELSLLVFALVLAVASLTSVAFLSDRIGRAVDRDANRLLGGDVLLTADHPWGAEFAREAKARGLAVSESWLLMSMVSSAEQAQLAAIKAADARYPLRGELRIADGPGLPERGVRGVPEPGEVWLDERLFGALEIKPGDSVGVGKLRLRVAGMLTYEADRGASLIALAPRLVMNLTDVPASGLVTVGSRVAYRLHFAGDAQAVTSFEAWSRTHLGRGEAVESIANSRPELRDMLDRAHRFLSLAALLAVVLAAVAVALVSRRFVNRHLDGCAAMRCFGATQSLLMQILIGEFVWLGLFASLCGALLGLGIQFLLAASVANIVDAALPAPSAWPVLQGVAACFVLLLGFSAPQLLRLGRVSTLRVMRREFPSWRPSSLSSVSIAAAALVGLMLWVAGDIRLGLWVALGFAGALVVYGLVAWLAVMLLARMRRLAGATGGGWRYGLASLSRHAGPTILQAVALALGLTAMLLLSVGRHDLLQSWRNKIPPDAPNRFIVNIQPDQLAALRKSFADAGLAEPLLLPMIRGRLVAINGQAVHPEAYAEQRAQRLAEREFNLSHAAELQAGNRIVAGRWHGDTHQPEFSVERGIAQTLGLKLGDRLAFDVAGTRIEAPITSLRTLEWDSMRVNFFVTASPGLFDGQPTSYITSFRLPDAQRGFGIKLAREFPNLSLIDVSAVLRQVQDTMDSLIRAVQLVFALALVAGAVVMAAALQSTHDERAHELAILRTLGAGNTVLRGALLAEFSALGLVASGLGALGAMLIAAVVAEKVFQFSFQPTLWAFGAGALAGLAGIVLTGWLGTRRVMRQPPLQSLRALA
ncbi:MAG: ABC transporter permease [Betaproteobacteria bacterium]|nr:ABC transporter permease [Betaproteobacteria bacterium]